MIQLIKPSDISETERSASQTESTGESMARYEPPKAAAHSEDPEFVRALALYEKIKRKIAANSDPERGPALELRERLRRKMSIQGTEVSATASGEPTSDAGEPAMSEAPTTTSAGQPATPPGDPAATSAETRGRARTRPQAPLAHTYGYIFLPHNNMLRSERNSE
jgi:hypothetical protein